MKRSVIHTPHHRFEAPGFRFIQVTRIVTEVRIRWIRQVDGARVVIPRFASPRWRKHQIRTSELHASHHENDIRLSFSAISRSGTGGSASG
jgi:hypothetical protein